MLKDKVWWVVVDVVLFIKEFCKEVFFLMV